MVLCEESLHSVSNSKLIEGNENISLVFQPPQQYPLGYKTIAWKSRVGCGLGRPGAAEKRHMLCQQLLLTIQRKEGKNRS